MGRAADGLDAETRRILFGTDEAPPASVPLRAGPLALTLRGGALHGLARDGCPLWHAVTFPYRDADWGTPPFTVEHAAHEERDGGFRVEVSGAFATLPRLRTRLVAEAGADGRLRVEAEAVPDGDLLTNRTGLCLLLPTAAGGDPIEVEHDDGRVTRSTVPILVPPWPPFTAIRALRWRRAPDLWACCAFEGDSFEFEDQRNNADLSFKVYSRSNMMPRPYRLRAGVPVRQALELWVERTGLLPLSGEGGNPSRPVEMGPRVAAQRRRMGSSGAQHRSRDAFDPGRPAGDSLPSQASVFTYPDGREVLPFSPSGRRWRAAPDEGSRAAPEPLIRPAGHLLPAGEKGTDDDAPRCVSPVTLQGREEHDEPGEIARTLPRFGLAVPPGGDRGLLRRAVDAIRPAYLHAGLHVDALASADLATLAEAGPPLRLELTLGDRPPSDAELAPLLRARPEAVALFPSPPEAVAALRRALPGVTVGGGTPHFFAQINRLEGLGPVDHLTFTVSPLVHGAEDDDVMACPRAIPGLVSTLRHRRPGLPIHLGPSAIAMRSSPLGRMPPADGLSRRAMAGDDPRARGLFGAAWVLAFAAACAEAGVAAVTLMAVEGPSGVAARRGPAVVWHPAAAVLARLHGPATVVPSPVAPSARLTALALRRGGGRDLLLANLEPEPVEVALGGWAAEATFAVLDAAVLREAASRDAPPGFAPQPGGPRIALGPYAVARLAERTPEGGHA